MKFEDLEAFLDVAELGGFSRAAAHRRVAQSALSRRVARLEHQLGVQLFERRARGVLLTEHGVVLLERARDLVRQLDVIKRETQELSTQPMGEVRLAIPPMTATVLAPRVVREIRERHPGIKLSVREGTSGQIHSWVLSGEVDVALLYNPEESVEFEIDSVVKAPLFLIAPVKAPHELQDQIDKGMRSDGRFRFKSIGSVPLIMPNPLHGVRKLVERMAAEHRVAINIAIEADGLGVAVALVREGLGCTVFSYAGEDGQSPRQCLRLIPFSPPMSWTLAVICRADPRPRRAAVAVKQVLKHHIDSLLGAGFWVERGPTAAGNG